MDVQTLTFIFVGATFALYIAIAIWSRAGNTDDFYVAKKKRDKTKFFGLRVSGSSMIY